jgi:hypothetical protein
METVDNLLRRHSSIQQVCHTSKVLPPNIKIKFHKQFEQVLNSNSTSHSGNAAEVTQKVTTSNVLYVPNPASLLIRAQNLVHHHHYPLFAN